MKQSISICFAILFIFFSVARVSGQEMISFAGQSIEIGESESLRASREFTGSVGSKVAVILDKHSQGERLLSILDISGITAGLEMLAVNEILRAYLEGLIVSWGGKLDGVDWEWESQGLQCHETQALFGESTFCYRGCLSEEIKKNALIFAVDWKMEECKTKDKEGLALWLRKRLAKS